MSSPPGDSPSTETDSRPHSFADLAAARRNWIEQVLKPWCRQAALKPLLEAEREWLDIAGRVDVQASLWSWAWDRFPQLTHEGLPGVDETHRVTVRLRDGQTVTGFPDSRQSQRGQLVLLGSEDDGRLRQRGPYSIDEITSVERLTD